MEAISSFGARVVSLADASRVLTSRTAGFFVCVTFDDGYYDTLENAVPVLRELGIPATIFVPTGAIDGTAGLYWYTQQPRMLSWDDLRDLTRDPLVSIGAHSRRHPNLTHLPDDEAWAEIAGSKKDLETQLGCEVTSFAYPAGFAGEREASMVAEAGYRVGVTTSPGPNNPDTPLPMLRRSVVTRRDDAGMFRARLEGLLDAPWGFQQLRARLHPDR
jgi:peptidoglycan/xylan/chitin deacetylase (PgdA/CDA1 family)